METFIIKNYPVKAIPIRVGDLLLAKCSFKFLQWFNTQSHLVDDSILYVKCDDNGVIKYRGKHKEYQFVDTNKWAFND